MFRLVSNIKLYGEELTREGGGGVGISGGRAGGDDLFMSVVPASSKGCLDLPSTKAMAVSPFSSASLGE